MTILHVILVYMSPDTWRYIANQIIILHIILQSLFFWFTDNIFLRSTSHHQLTVPCVRWCSSHTWVTVINQSCIHQLTQTDHSPTHTPSHPPRENTQSPTEREHTPTHHHRRVILTDFCTAPWPLAISALHRVDSGMVLASYWTRLSQVRRGRPGDRIQSADGFLPTWLLTIRCRTVFAGTPGSKRATWPNRHATVLLLLLLLLLLLVIIIIMLLLLYLRLNNRLAVFHTHNIRVSCHLPYHRKCETTTSADTLSLSVLVTLSAA